MRAVAEFGAASTACWATVKRFVWLVLHHGDDRLQRQGIAVVRGQTQGPRDIRLGLVHAAHGQQQ